MCEELPHHSVDLQGVYFSKCLLSFEDPSTRIIELSEKTKMSRNTVSKYLLEMYKKEVLGGISLYDESKPKL